VKTTLCSLRQCQNFNQKWSGITIQMSARSLPKCCGFITLSASVICKNLAVTVWEMLVNLKSRILQWWVKLKSDQESVSGTGVPPKVNQFLWLVGPVITPIFNDIGSLLFVILLREWHTDVLLVEVITVYK